MKNIIIGFAVFASLFAGANVALHEIDERFLQIEASKPQLVWEVSQTLKGSVLLCSTPDNRGGWQVADMCRRNLYMRLRQQAKLGQFAQCNWQDQNEVVRFTCPQGTRI